jgi:hypothetical protein
MTDEQKRIAIAEACGWRQQPDMQDSACGIHGCKERHTYWLFRSKDMGTWHDDESPIPDYLNDLNAIHEAILQHFKTDDEMDHFDRVLAKTCWKNENWHNAFKVNNATARQRCDAFLTTKRLLTQTN